MPSSTVRHLLLACLVLAWPLVSYAPPKKMRTLPSQSKTTQDSSESSSADIGSKQNSAQAPANLPPGVTFSNSYTTTVSGPGLVSQEKDTRPEGSTPDVVVYAVEVDEQGNPIPPAEAQPPAEPAFSGEPELAIQPPKSPAKEESGGFLDFLFGPDEEEVPEPPADGLPAAADIPYPNLSPVTRSPRLGELVSINPQDKIAVMWLDSRYLAFYGDEVLISRRADLEITGVFAVTQTRDSKALGLELLYGEPTPGEEIIMPGPAYQQYILDLADSGAISLPN